MHTIRAADPIMQLFFRLLHGLDQKHGIPGPPTWQCRTFPTQVNQLSYLEPHIIPMQLIRKKGVAHN
jgi:hypothetical protein